LPLRLVPGTKTGPALATRVDRDVVDDVVTRTFRAEAR